MRGIVLLVTPIVLLMLTELLLKPAVKRLDAQAAVKKPSPTSWLIDCETHPRDIHVMPNDDYRPHVFERACWCRPRLDDLEGYGECVVHFAMDRREDYQDGRLRPH